MRHELMNYLLSPPFPPRPTLLSLLLTLLPINRTKTCKPQRWVDTHMERG